MNTAPDDVCLTTLVGRRSRGAPARWEPRPTERDSAREDARPTRSDLAPPAELPNRKKPAQGVRIDLGRPTLVFITVCTKDRVPWLACDEAHRLLVETWRRADAWLVGKFVLMPDHLHLFAAPRLGRSLALPGDPLRLGGRLALPEEPIRPDTNLAPPGAHEAGFAGRATLPRSRAKRIPQRGGNLALPDISVERWLRYWKSQFSKSHSHADWVWQSSAFHHRLRGDESYTQKWHYVQENPLRAGLVSDAVAWPYQGEVYALRW